MDYKTIYQVVINKMAKEDSSPSKAIKMLFEEGVFTGSYQRIRDIYFEMERTLKESTKDQVKRLALVKADRIDEVKEVEKHTKKSISMKLSDLMDRICEWMFGPVV